MNDTDSNKDEKPVTTDPKIMDLGHAPTKNTLYTFDKTNIDYSEEGRVDQNDRAK